MSSTFRTAALCLVTLAAISAVLFTSPTAQGPTPIPSVWLQSTTPGTAQTGNGNVGGTFMAGQFQGGGGGLTGVNADLLDGLNSTSFLQSVPVPLTLSGNSSSHIIRGTNSSIASSSAGVVGDSSGTSGITYGVFGLNNSSAGSGVFGLASAKGVAGTAVAGAGATYGVFGVAVSTSGTGSYGEASATSGTTYGGHFLSASPTGTGVFGESTSALGSPNGVYGRAVSVGGVGVFGEAVSATGSPAGVQGQTASTSGRGVLGLATSGTGTSYGGWFENLSTNGVGVFGWARATTGTTEAVHGLNWSTGGIGVFGEAVAATGLTYGGRFHSVSTAGYGVFGLASATNGSATGGLFQSNSVSGVGVKGLAGASVGTTYGGYFQTVSATGFGAYSTNDDLGANWDVELSGPNGAINTPGFVYREYTVSTRSAAIPIAYGSIDTAGAITSGTGNFTVTKPATGQYDIDVAGEAYTNSGFTVTITPISNNPRTTGVANGVGNAFRVNMWNIAAAPVLVDNSFQFTIWKADPSEPGMDGYTGPPEDNGGTGRKTFKSRGSTGVRH